MQAAFARMKPDAFFINMSRGNLIDEAALPKVLTEGRIAGAAMDVGRAPGPDAVARAGAPAQCHRHARISAA